MITVDMEIRVADFKIYYLKHQQKKENYIAIILMLPYINYYISMILNVLGYPTITTFTYVLVYFIGLIVYIEQTLRKPIIIFWVLGIAVFVFLLSILKDNDVLMFMFDFSKISFYTLASSNIGIFFGSCLPMLILFMSGVDLDLLLKVMKNYGIVLLILFIITTILYNFVFGVYLEYMTSAYASLVSIFVVYIYSSKFHIKIGYLLVFFSVIFIVIGGSRGALLTTSLFFMIDFFVNKRFNLFLRFLSGFCLVIIAINIQEIANQLSGYLLKFGYRSRMINVLLGEEGGVTRYSDRAELQMKILKKVGFWGKGIFSDRVITGGRYAHNWLLEMLVDYGLLFGAGIILFIFFMIAYSSFYIRKEVQILSYLNMVVSLILVKYMLSASYLQNIEFWFCIGILLCIFNIARNNHS